MSHRRLDRFAQLLGCLSFALTATLLQAQAAAEAVVRMKRADGQDAGTITLTEATAGVLFKYELSGLPPGPHALHVRDSGTCEGDFTSAGSIYNPLGAQHGFLNEEGPMAGDLPNVHAGKDGIAIGEFLSPFLTLSKETEETLFDADGAALVILEKPDDYLSDIDAEAPVRIACGTVNEK